MKFLLAFLLISSSAQAVYMSADDIRNANQAVGDALLHQHPKIDNHSIAEIKKELVSFDILKGNFDQNKKIKIIKNPLKSHGTFTLVKSKGLLWSTSKPLISTIRITQDDIVSLSNGKKVVFISMKDQPALGVIGKILFALFSTDMDELQRHFQFTNVYSNLDGWPSPDKWSATLKPNDPAVAKVIDSIYICGRKTVRRLLLSEANGDSTEIIFKEVSSKKPLTKEEEALFE